MACSLVAIVQNFFAFVTLPFGEPKLLTRYSIHMQTNFPFVIGLHMVYLLWKGSRKARTTGLRLAISYLNVESAKLRSELGTILYSLLSFSINYLDDIHTRYALVSFLQLCSMPIRSISGLAKLPVFKISFSKLLLHNASLYLPFSSKPYCGK